MTITSLLLIMVFIGVLGWTAIAQKYGNPTVSMVMRDAMWNMTFIAFTLGALIGHWSGSLVTMPIKGLAGYLIPFEAAYMIFDGVWYWRKGANVRHWTRYPLWHIIVGVVVGLIFWGQR